MTATIDPELRLQGGLAISRQIETQIRDYIVSGSLTAGEQLPTVRTLAVELAVNPAAVGEAYSELEREGFVTSEEGSGTFVAAMPLEEASKSGFREEIERLCLSCLTQAARCGYTSEEVVNLLRKFAKRGDST
jgi:GntR family transcriptional regulator